MATPSVECLRCDACRPVEEGRRASSLDPGECPGCGYLGWALSLDLDESTRQKMLRWPPARRARLYAA